MSCLLPQRFPHKLYEIVNDPKNACYISWRQTGGFVIWNVNGLCEDILKKHSMSTSQATFRRQLLLYGFTITHKDSKTGVWYIQHDDDLFIRGRTDLLDKMVDVSYEKRKQREKRLFPMRKKRRFVSQHIVIPLSSSLTKSDSSSLSENSNSETDQEPLWKKVLAEIVCESEKEY